MTLGIICASIGFLGNITLLVLSTMIRVPVTKSYLASDGSTHYYGGGDVLGYSFWGFIEEYRLMAILIAATILLLIGILLLVRSCQKNKAPQSLN